MLPASWIAPVLRADARSPSGHSISSRHGELLLKAGQPVRLGSRALDILIALVERRGELVSKGDLMARIWPHTFVEESNLRVQVAALRRALGDTRGSNRYLATIHGRGYRFVAPVTLSKAPRPPAPERAAGPTHNLLVPVARIVDREDTVGRSRRNCRISVS